MPLKFEVFKDKLKKAKANSDILEIDLSSQGLVDQDLDAIKNLTHRKFQIASINLSDNQLKKFESVNYFLSLCVLKYLKQIDFSNNQLRSINEKEVDKFLRFISNSPIEKIDFSYNFFIQKDIDHWLERLAQMDTKSTFQIETSISNGGTEQDRNLTLIISRIKNLIKTTEKIEENLDSNISQISSNGNQISLLKEKQDGENPRSLKNFAADIPHESLQPIEPINQAVREIARNSMITYFPFSWLPLTALKHHRYAFLGQAVSLPEANAKRAYLMVSFIDGAQFILQRAWPAAFLGLLLHDFGVYFRFPQDRYGSTWPQILAGLSPNQLTLSNHFGTDLSGDYLNYWLWPSLLLLFPLLGGFVNLSLASYQLSQKKNGLHYIRYELSFKKGLISEDPATLITALENFAQKENHLTAFRSIAMLAEAADSFKNAVHDSLLESDQNNVKVLAEQALKRILTSRSPFLIRLLASYELWSLGRDRSRVSNFYLIPLLIGFFYVLFARARFWMVEISHAMQFYQYITAMQYCYKEGDSWNYLSALANYVCSRCGNLNVYLNDIYQDQSCLNDILAQPRSPEFILQVIQQLGSHANYSSYNFSNQNYINWPLDQWQQIWGNFSQVAASHPISLIISSPSKNNYWDADYLQPILTFLNRQPVRVIDFHNWSISANEIRMVLQIITNNTAFAEAIEMINFNNLNLGDEGVCYVAKTLSYLPNLQVLQLGDVGMTDYGCQQLFGALKNSSVVSINVQNNLLGNRGIESIIANLPSCFYLKKLVISDIDLSTADMQALGKAIRYSSVEKLCMENCNLDDNQVAEFMQQAPAVGSKLKYLIMPYNVISDDGIVTIVSNSKNSTIRHLDVSYNPITDQGIFDAAPV